MIYWRLGQRQQGRIVYTDIAFSTREEAKRYCLNTYCTDLDTQTGHETPSFFIEKKKKSFDVVFLALASRVIPVNISED